jgi:hypothetical protein
MEAMADDNPVHLSACRHVQAGAAKVYAVEASGMAKYAQKLASSNAVGKAIQVGCRQLALPTELLKPQQRNA